MPGKNEDIIGKYVVKWKDLAQAEREADIAIRKMKAQVSKIPRNHQSDYKEDGDYVTKTRKAFMAEIKKIKAKKTTNADKAFKLYGKFILNLLALQQSNKKWEAVIALKIIVTAAMLPSIGIGWINTLGKQSVLLEKELKELKKLYEKAKNQVTEAQIQRGINLGLAAISFFLGPVGLLGRAAVAIGSIGASTLADALLGPDKFDAIDTVSTSVGDIASVHPKLSKAGQKFAGATTAILSFKQDSDEIEDAEKIVKEIKKRLASVNNQIAFLEKMLKKNLPKLLKFQGHLTQLQKKMKKAIQTAKDADRQYRYLLDAFQKK